MSRTETIIYKYPLVKAMCDANFYINSIYLNPHANLIEFCRTNMTQINKFYFSRNPSNKAVEMMMKNRNLIDVNGLVCNTNPKIGPLLEKTMHQFKKSTWFKLAESHNPAALAFLEKHPKKIDWHILSGNESEYAIRILEKNPDKIRWHVLSANPSALDIMCDYQDKIDWWSFCKNPNPRAIRIIEHNLADINIEALSSNPDAFHIISENLDKISLHWLARNPNPKVFDLFMEHPDLMEVSSFLVNPNVLPYLETHMELLDDVYNLREFIHNPNCVQFFEKKLAEGFIFNDDMDMICMHMFEHTSIYDLDYQAMSKIRSKLLYPELIEKAFHPSRVGKWLDYYCENGGAVDDFEM